MLVTVLTPVYNMRDSIERTMESVLAQTYREYDIAWSDIRVCGKGHSFVKHARIGRWWTTARFCHLSMFRTRQAALELPYAVRGLDDDFDMILRAVNRKMKICVCGECLANYSLGGAGSRKELSGMAARIRMKYDTYRRNGFSRLYLPYCAAVEIAKFLYQ